MIKKRCHLCDSRIYQDSWHGISAHLIRTTPVFYHGFENYIIHQPICEHCFAYYRLLCFKAIGKHTNQFQYKEYFENQAWDF
jgi:hypothetical protein